MWPDFPLFPEVASTLADEIDALVLAWTAVSVFFSLLIAAVILVFFIKYRRRHPREVGAPLEGSMLLEVVWSIIPGVIALAMFVWGTLVFFEVSRPPAEADEYYAIGKQWMWKFQHPEGVREINDLHVPAGRPIKLTMTSQDVIHSVYLPAQRVKQDVLPGRYTTLWFEATKPGRYHLFCAEYCGAEHSLMRGSIIVMEPDDYDAWLAGSPVGEAIRDVRAEAAPHAGRDLYARLSCGTCHGAEGDGRAVPGMGVRGPALAGLFGRDVDLHGGGSVVADETYLRESILNPQAKVVEGWQPNMPTYRGQVDEEDVLALITYIKSLEEAEAPDRLASADPAGASR